MDRIFIWVWRINGLLVMVGTILVIGSLIFNQLERNTRNTPERSVTNIASDPEGKEKWFLASPIQVEGTDIVYMKLVSENSEVSRSEVSRNEQPMYYFGGRHDNSTYKSKNILFLNEVTNSANWLFSGVNQLITSVEELPKQTYQSRYYSEQQVEKTTAIVYSVIVNDTNNDGTINVEDEASLALSNASGSDYRVVLENFERVLSVSLVKQDTLSIIYQAGGAIYSLKYAIESSRTLSKTALPEIK